MGLRLATQTHPESVYVPLLALKQCFKDLGIRSKTNEEFFAEIKKAMRRHGASISLPEPILSANVNDGSLFLNSSKKPSVIRKIEQDNKTTLLQIAGFLQSVISKREARGDLWPEGRLQLGIAYAELQNYENAQRVLEEVRQICSSGGTYRSDVDSATQSSPTLHQSYTSEKLYSLVIEASYHLGKVLYEEGRNYDRAVSLLTEVTEENPDNDAAYYYLGQAIRAQIEQDMYKRAEEALNTYLARGAPVGKEDEVREFLQSRQSSIG